MSDVLTIVLVAWLIVGAVASCAVRAVSRSCSCGYQIIHAKKSCRLPSFWERGPETNGEWLMALLIRYHPVNLFLEWASQPYAPPPPQPCIRCEQRDALDHCHPGHAIAAKETR